MMDPAHLSARPKKNTPFPTLKPGSRSLGLDWERDGLLHIPRNLSTQQPLPLMVMLHGAGGEAIQSIIPFQDLADHTGTLILAPESRKMTWDVILNGFGDDVSYIDEALQEVFDLFPIHEKHVAIGGFSDGASYALSLGMTNGDLFTHIMAFSPGFMAPTTLRDSPPIFISHGIDDRVLPIDSCSRRLVPLLRQADLDVSYYEFEGGHTIPPHIGREAFHWFLGPQEAQPIRSSAVPSEKAHLERT